MNIQTKNKPVLGMENLDFLEGGDWVKVYKWGKSAKFSIKNELINTFIQGLISAKAARVYKKNFKDKPFWWDLIL